MTTSTLKEYNESEVSKHNTKNDGWVIIDGWVIDISLMFPLHPGGEDILLPYLGKNATSIFRDPDSHIHSKSALHLAKKFTIGYISGQKTPNEIKDQASFKKKASDYGVNIDNGLVAQAAALDSNTYEEFIHNVLVLNNTTLKYFDNPALEIFTRSPWYCVPLVWIPVMFLSFYLAVKNGLSLFALPFCIFIGLIFWHLLEYNLHKRIFHMKPNNYYTRILHFLLHGYHHIAPMDHLRLTFPPLPAAMIAAIIFIPGLFILPAIYMLSIMGGILLGYIYYDLMHYYLHHAPPQFFFAKELKVHHLYHHYKDESYNYGISLWLFDYIFDTFDPTMLAAKKKREKLNIE